ncbi:MAG TPA: hypothetical protein VIZ65_01860 [Cellvibrionaceae bacterium]
MRTKLIQIICWWSLFIGNESVAAEQTSATAQDEVMITVKTGQWMNRATATTVKPSYTLDVFATETANPKLPQRQPDRNSEITKSAFYLKSLMANTHRDEGYTISVPANRTLYLSSYFEQRPSLLSNTIRYCVGIEQFRAQPNKNYILATNFVLLGPFSADCHARIMTPEEYQQQASANTEQTNIGNLTRKELSLRYASAQAALLTASLISRKSDYQLRYLDAAVDRAQQDVNSADEYAVSMAAWLARITSESNSSKHIAAMEKIAQNAVQTNKPLGKKMQKYLDNPSTANSEIYSPKPIAPPSGFSLAQLAILAAQENLKAKNKYELEAAARDIIKAPNAFTPADFDVAEHTLKEFAQSADEEDIASAIWVTRVLASSNNKKYLSSLEELKRLPLHKKLAKEINLALQALTK